MIEASQRMLGINSQGGEAKDGGGMNPVMKRHLELEIKTSLIFICVHSDLLSLNSEGFLQIPLDSHSYLQSLF
jgi:hypothetical protein